MSDVAVYSIVEGHGEVEALRLLLDRIWIESLDSPGILTVLTPHRVSRGKILTDSVERQRAANLARLKLRQSGAGRVLLLVLVDAEDDCQKSTHPGGLGPALREAWGQAAGDLPLAVVVADRQYECWLRAGVEAEETASSAEGSVAKNWLEAKYGHWSETADQPSLTASFDLAQAVRFSPSLARLCREMRKTIS